MREFTPTQEAAQAIYLFNPSDQLSVKNLKDALNELEKVIPIDKFPIGIDLALKTYLLMHYGKNVEIDDMAVRILRKIEEL